MGEVTISSKYQVVIPKEIRKQLKLTVGQKLRVVVAGNTISMVPDIHISEMRGFLKGMNTDDLREENDRI
mgnify:CR=1 FL=1